MNNVLINSYVSIDWNNEVAVTEINDALNDKCEFSVYNKNIRDLEGLHITNLNYYVNTLCVFSTNRDNDPTQEKVDIGRSYFLP